jgi:DNA-binding NarL/FixJ family response regulator
MAKVAALSPRNAERRCDSRTVALLAAEGPDREITQILEDQYMAVTSFPCLQALLALDDPGSPGDHAAIVLWVKDTMASIPGVLERLSSRFAQTPIVIACEELMRWEVRAALAAGAAGIVVGEELQSTLGACLQAVMAGQTCVPREHWRQIERPVLTAREKQVLGLVVMGYMNSEIAKRLFLAESTVKGHLSSAFGKLGVRSRSEAADLIASFERGVGMTLLSLGVKTRGAVASDAP